MLQPIIRYLAPHRCIGCGTESSILCAWCKADAESTLPPRCYRCQALTEQSAVCVRCRRKSALRHVWVAGEYGGVGRKLVQLLKYERVQEAAVVMAGMVDDVLPYLGPGVIITHIPTATSRVRQRGYDQARLMARQLGRTRNHTVVSLLVRNGQSRQVGAKRAERTSQLGGAYRVSRPELVRNAHILLIDDVLTTGATMEEAAKTLRAAGASRVDAAVFAQKL